MEQLLLWDFSGPLEEFIQNRLRFFFLEGGRRYFSVQSNAAAMKASIIQFTMISP
jgi:hypothetical protein